MVYEWDELREVDTIRKQVWWKIIEEDGERKMVEISEDEGESAQRVLEEQDGKADGIAQVEGECIPCRCLAYGLLTDESEAVASLSL